MAISSAKPVDEHEVLTLPEAAAWLRISERTLAGRLDEYPHFHAGKQIRFLKSALRDAVRERSVKQ